MKKHTLTTQKQIRQEFWDFSPEFAQYEGRRQNDCPTDVRVAFVDFVDSLARNGEISHKLAERVTL
jgi:hypothetical protein